MRLYPLTDTGAVDAGGEHFEPADDGGFDFPGPLSDQLHAMAIGGVRQWEDAIERQHRMIAEEAARRADPATLLAAVEELVAAARRTAQAEPAEAAEPAKAAPAAKAPRAAASKTAAKS